MDCEVQDGVSSGPSDRQRSLNSQYSTFVGFENRSKNSVEVLAMAGLPRAASVVQHSTPRTELSTTNLRDTSLGMYGIRHWEV